MQLGYQELDVRAIAPSPTNPRKHFDEAALAELSISIEQAGILQPIVVRPYPFNEYPDPDGKLAVVRFEIIAGERRWRAAKMAGLDNIPAIVKDIPTRQVLEIQIIENLQRRDVNELEEADGYRLMMDQHGYTADELAEKVGKSKAYIYARLKLCDLGPEPRVALTNGSISASVGLLIARIPTYAMQARAVHEVVEQNLSARAAAEHIQTRYMLKLSNATWDLADADLCPNAGACSTCPKNTSTDRDQYADVAADVCTDPDCWGNKRTAQVEQTAAAHMAAGHTVIRGEQAKELMNWGPTSYVHGLCWVGAVQENLLERLTGAPRTFIEYHRDGELYEFIPRDDVSEVQQAKWKAEISPEEIAEQQKQEDAWVAAWQAQAAEAKAVRAYADALYAQTRAAYSEAHRAAVGTPAATLRAHIISLAEGDWITDQTSRQYNLPDFDYSEDDNFAQRTASIRDRLATMPASELLDLLADNECNPAGWAEWQQDEGLGTLRGYAAAHGLDPDAIRAELAAAETGQPPADEAAETAPTPQQAAPAQDLFGDETQPAETPAPAEQAAQAPASTPAKPKAKPKAKATPAPKASAKSSKSSSRASPAGGKGKTTTSPTAKAKKSAEVVA